ncbi:hypothetical protein [Cryobacterium sp. PH29-G1]|uniref:hypothetical protein n=1 Tax=Cryobacterium sp. PH29-G1 TaxID=3046211 RepID=UPI0024B92604|nr:hypothetical protein [Cryobacterium sp. PH29-G1]MDJ0350774.1 hypothetical protein [Cryobacterium sp. PH29-G1]
MSLRITSTSTKIGYVVAAYVVGPLIVLFVALVAGPPLAAAATVMLLLAVVGFAVRTFRGEGEPVAAPRAWWRMTAQPTSGFVFSALFLGQAVSLAFTAAPRTDVGAFIAIAPVYAGLGALFAYSSIRLRSVRHKRG